MKTRYIIIVDEDEEPMCVSKEGAPGAVSVLIIEIGRASCRERV